MPSSRSQAFVADEYPSLLWVAVPSALLLSAYLVRKWYLARRLRIHGIGRGAPGFQTNVRKVRITPEIAERLRRGEEVSPEEIAEASARAEKEDVRLPPRPRDIVEIGPGEPRPDASEGEGIRTSTPANEWLPENLTQPKKRGKGKRK